MGPNNVKCGQTIEHATALYAAFFKKILYIVQIGYVTTLFNIFKKNLIYLIDFTTQLKINARKGQSKKEKTNK